MILLNFIILWIHIFSAVIFVGGSFFIWLVVWPASYEITSDEKERTRIVGRIAKRFAYFTHVTVGILIVTGIYNATWYLNDNPSLLLSTGQGRLLLANIILAGIVIAMIYGNNIYHGKKIMRLSREGKLEQVKKIRKITHMISFLSLALLLAVVGMMTAMQFY